MTVDPNLKPWTFWHRPAWDGTTRIMRRKYTALIALTVRDGLLVVLILHAVLTVLNSPRRTR